MKVIVKCDSKCGVCVAVGRNACWITAARSTNEMGGLGYRVRPELDKNTGNHKRECTKSTRTGTMHKQFPGNRRGALVTTGVAEAPQSG